MSSEFPAACATLLVLLAPAGCGEPRTPGEPTPVSVGRADGTAPAPSQAGRVVVAGTDTTLENDDYVLNGATITGDTLTVSVSYSGGCRRHVFTLVIAASFVESSPLRLPAVLRHDANGDTCCGSAGGGTGSVGHPGHDRLRHLPRTRVRRRRHRARCRLRRRARARQGA